MAKENLLDLLRKATDLLGDLKKKEKEKDDEADEIKIRPSDIYDLVGISSTDERDLMLHAGTYKALDAIIEAAEKSDLFPPRALVALMIFAQQNIEELQNLYKKVKKQKENK